MIPAHVLAARTGAWLCPMLWLLMGAGGAVLAYTRAPGARDLPERLKHGVLLPVLVILLVIAGPIGLLMMVFTSALKNCPYCKTRIRANATVCRACGRNV